jgi:outer membrane protein OmpA-like peptidoglycan-associated protein
MLKTSKITLAVLLVLSASALAQAQRNAPAEPGSPTPTFRVNVVSRTARAVNYGHRGGSTKINFKGTDLMPDAQGAATVQSKRGDTKVVIELQGLQKPTSFGNEYLTYVLWAISPEGRPVNLGEVLVGDNHRSKLDTTTQLQAFALIVTAEPYYAVRRPSNLVVLENEVRSDTVGTTEAVESKYELIDRGGYIPTGYTFDPVVLNAKLPLEFYEARNAMRIAESAGAEKYATPSYEKATLQMKQADSLATRKHADKKSLISTSRQVVQTAEDAREIAMKNIETARLDDERGAAADREADARTRTDQESQRRITAEIATSDAVRQRNEADRRSLGAQADAQRSANAQADAERARATAEQQQQTAQYDSDRNRAAAAASDIATSDAVRQRNEADRRSLDAQADAQRSANAQTEAERARATAEQQQRAAQADADRNRTAAASSDQQYQQAVRDREELRARLLQQFNAILVTHDTARGLVVNMSDVLFDSGQFTLRPLAREKLAKISGIVLAYPSLRLAIEGNTDSIGTQAYNQILSEKRAQGVRGYLTQQGVPESSTTAAGFGKDQPIASNTTAEGRQQNRRVELVVSGEVIGTQIVAPNAQPLVSLSSPK